MNRFSEPYIPPSRQTRRYRASDVVETGQYDNNGQGSSQSPHPVVNQREVMPSPSTSVYYDPYQGHDPQMGHTASPLSSADTIHGQPTFGEKTGDGLPCAQDTRQSVFPQAEDSGYRLAQFSKAPPSTEEQRDPYAPYHSMQLSRDTALDRESTQIPYRSPNRYHDPFYRAGDMSLSPHCPDYSPDSNRLKSLGTSDFTHGTKEADDDEDEDEPVPTFMQSIKSIKIRTLLQPKYYIYYVIIILICVATAFITIYHDKIITFLRPISKSVRGLTAGWVIPIVLLFIISFPPLFGHEIVAILCGVVYGLWIGFAIVCAGTFAGEIGNFYAFRYYFKDRMKHYETKSLNYACLAHIVRHGSFMVVIMARLSAIPGHFTTAIFASVGMSIWIFALAAFLTLPKQLAIVYLGALLNKEDPNSTNTSADRVKTIVSDAVLAVSFLITVGAAIFLYMKMRKVRVLVARERRKAAKEKALKELAGESELGHLPTGSSSQEPKDGPNSGQTVTTPTPSRTNYGRQLTSQETQSEVYSRDEGYSHLLQSVEHLPHHNPTYPPPEPIRYPFAAAIATNLGHDRNPQQPYQSPYNARRPSSRVSSPGSQRSSRRDLIRIPMPLSGPTTPKSYTQI